MYGMVAQLEEVFERNCDCIVGDGCTAYMQAARKCGSGWAPRIAAMLLISSLSYLSESHGIVDCLALWQIGTLIRSHF